MVEVDNKPEKMPPALRILVADDDRVSRQVIQKVLQ